MSLTASDPSRNLEYNYRIWDINNKEYLDPNKVHILQDVRGAVFIVDPVTQTLQPTDKRDYVYEWNSKFTDVNRLPIFGGDIVRISHTTQPAVDGEVTWDQAARRVSFTHRNAPGISENFADVLSKMKAAGGKHEVVGSRRLLELQEKKSAEQKAAIEVKLPEVLQEIDKLVEQNQ